MPFKDYYSLLGIPTNATLQDVKTAYRKLSKKFHPDHNPGDTYFEERFKEIQEAYNTLSDEYRRRIYDFNYKNTNLRQLEQDIKEKGEELEKQRKEYKKWQHELKQKEEEIDLKTDKKIMFYVVIAVAVFALIIFFATRVSDNKKDDDALVASILKDTVVQNVPEKIEKKLRIKDGKVSEEFMNGFWKEIRKTKFDKILNGKWAGTVFQIDTQDKNELTLISNPANDIYEVQYPSAGCSGTWEIKHVSDSSIEFKETIATGKGGCKDGGIIKLEEINERKMLYKYYWPDTSSMKVNGIINKD
jgi:curved DNA-binding protein CbpA